MADEGIRRILEAEEAAEEIVTRARQKRNDQLKRAEAEADKEIAAYRQERTVAFANLAASQDGSVKEKLARVQADTQRAMDDAAAVIGRNKSRVVQLLLDDIVVKDL